MNILGYPNERESEFSQGKFTQNHTTASAMNVSHMMLSNLQLNEPHQQTTVEQRRLPPSGQPAHSSSSLLSTHHQNSHGNYVDIDAIDSLLLQQENENNYLHYSTNNINTSQTFDRQPAENHMQKLMVDSTNSPIYENPSFLRPESPIYSNTHSAPHSQPSIASLYSKSQNIYSNLPAIASGATSASYANLQQPHQHQVLTHQSECLRVCEIQANNFSFHTQFCSSPTSVN